MAKKGERRKVHTGKLVHEEEHAEGQHDFTPWVEMTSSRLTAARYDRYTEAIQVEWGNGNPGYTYKAAGYETWRSFIRASSKGKFVNSHLNPLDYAPDASGCALPSNDKNTNPLSRGKRIIGETKEPSGKGIIR
jgi:hypothetical protein